MASKKTAPARRLRGGVWGPILGLALMVIAATMVYKILLAPHWARAYGQELPFDRAMFGKALAQPIPFSHRLHVTDKEIDCNYCHSLTGRSLSAGLPSVELCLGCHNSIIPRHEEILKLKRYQAEGKELPWKRVYYNPDHVFFPHYRHIGAGIRCQRCHGEVEKVDRLRQVTFYMGFCIQCHDQVGASRDCAACHQ